MERLYRGPHMFQADTTRTATFTTVDLHDDMLITKLYHDTGCYVLEVRRDIKSLVIRSRDLAIATAKSVEEIYQQTESIPEIYLNHRIK